MFTIHIDTDHSIISPYALMVFLSFAIGISLMYILNIKAGVRKNIANYTMLLCPAMSAFGAMVLTYVTAMRQAIGLSSMGGLFGMYAGVFTMALIINNREEAKIIFRNCTLVLPLMYSISKLGCLFAGCCYGISYNGIFCIKYIVNKTETICVFPVQLAETIVFFIIFVTGIILFKKHKRYTIFLVFILSMTAKGLLDFMRESHVGKMISFNQLLCLITLFIGTGIAIGYNYFITHENVRS